MSDPIETWNLILTEAGLEAALAAKRGGFAVDITHMAAGDAAYEIETGASGRTAQTALQNELQRVEISEAIERGNGQTSIAAVFDGPRRFLRARNRYLSRRRHALRRGQPSPPGDVLEIRHLHRLRDSRPGARRGRSGKRPRHRRRGADPAHHIRYPRRPRKPPQSGRRLQLRADPRPQILEGGGGGGTGARGDDLARHRDSRA